MNDVRRTTDLGAQEILEHLPVGEHKKTIGSSFFRGEHCNFNPYRADFSSPDFLRRFLLKGWMPDEPIIGEETTVTAFGSCFAEHITKHLMGIGYSVSKKRNPDIYISSMGEGMVNVHALLQQFEWALEGVNPPDSLWHGYKSEEYGCRDDIRLRTRAAFLETDFFVITLGLSEVWYDEQTGGVFWRAVPMKNYDAARHKFRVCSLQETKEAIGRIWSLIRKHVPDSKLLFTLSPIPLAATFRSISCITANSASKAILRAALDEFYRYNSSELNKHLFYFPSYEIISELFYLKFEQDGRHPQHEIIKLIMQLFESIYCKSGIDVQDIEKRYQQLRVLNGRAVAEEVTKLSVTS